MSDLYQHIFLFYSNVKYMGLNGKVLLIISHLCEISHIVAPRGDIEEVIN